MTRDFNDILMEGGPEAVRLAWDAATPTATTTSKLMTTTSELIKAGDYVSLADTVMKSIEWVWRGRLAVGKLTLLSGAPAQNQSKAQAVGINRLRATSQHVAFEPTTFG